MIRADPLAGLPEIRPGDDLARLIVEAMQDGARTLDADDIVVVAHKAISKAEGRTRPLRDVEPELKARELAAAHGKDARLVQVVLDESQEILRAVRGVLIVATRHGFVCANAGVDASNVPGQDTVAMLPLDPDASARSLRARIAELTGFAPGVVITDSFGRAWRVGQCDVAIGVAGVSPVEDWRGREDAQGRELRASVIAVADQLAALADLAREKDSMQPVVIVSGAGRHVTQSDGPGAAAMIRPREEDLFR